MNTNQKPARPVKVSLEAALRSIPKTKSKELQAILSHVVQDLYDKLPWDETSPKSTGGIYTAMQRKNRKFGMSLTNVRERTNKEHQPELRDVRQLLDETAARNLIPHKHIRKVVALKLPGLCFHQSNRESLHLLITLQLAEMAYACIHASDCNGIGIVCERLTQEPSEDVQAAVKEHEFTADTIREGQRLLVDVSDSHSPRSVKNFNTWPHMGTYLRDDHFFQTLDPETQDFIKEHTRFEPDEYITNLKHGEIFAGWNQAYQDAIKEPPRVTKDLKPIAAKLHPLLASDETSIANAEEVRLCISAIEKNSGNYSHHDKEHSKEDWSNALEALLSEQLIQGQIPTSTIITVESHALENLEREKPIFCEAFFKEKILVEEKTDETSKTEETVSRIWLIETTSGHTILSYPTPFIAYRGNIGEDRRLNGIQNQLAVQDFLAALRLVSKESVEQSRAMGTTFLMGLDGSFRAARYAASPNHFRRGNKRDILCVSKHIGAGIGYTETLFLRCDLGRTKFERLLRIFGMVVGPDTPSPLELDFQCPGCPAFGGLNAQACCCSTEEEEMPYYCMVGAKTPLHHFRGNFACQKCLKGWDRRDRVYLEELQATSKPKALGPEERKRLRAYQESDEQKKAATRGQRQRAVEAKGLETVRLLERPHNLTRQAKDSTDMNRRDGRNKASARSYEKSLAKGGPKKKSGGARLQGKYLRYIPQVKTLLERSLLFLGKVFTERHIPVPIDTIHFYWDLLCKREVKRGRKYIMMDGAKVRETEYVDNNPNSRILYAEVEYKNIRAGLCETKGCSARSVKIKSEKCKLVVSETDMKKFQTLKVQTTTHEEFVEIILEEFYQRIETVSPQLLVVPAAGEPKRSNPSQATPWFSPMPTTKKQKTSATVTPEV